MAKLQKKGKYFKFCKKKDQKTKSYCKEEKIVASVKF